jgi:hypothetical protein
VVETFDEMLLEQNGKCKICSREIGCTIREEDIDAAVVDHCDETGKIRGLLCHQCNRGIGLLKHDVEILLKAVEYLRG